MKAKGRDEEAKAKTRRYVYGVSSKSRINSLKTTPLKSVDGKKQVSLVAMILVISALALFTAVASATDIYVPDDYARILWAIDNATAGDTIIVRDGTYTENVDVNKRLTIRSENGSASTIVQAGSSDEHVFEVTTDLVNISGFTVKNAAAFDKAGIRLKTVEHCNISANNVKGNFNGIELLDSCNNTITGNNASNNYLGIDLSNSSDNTISWNTVSNNDHGGIWLFEWCNNNTISGNRVSGTTWCGIYVAAKCNENTISGNKVSANTWCGILLKDRSDGNTISGNRVSHTSYGIRLDYSSNNTITSNNVNNNKEGISLHVSSNNNTISGNIASYNEWGIFLESGFNNRLMNNTANSNSIGILLWSSFNNIMNNNVSNNLDGIFLSGSSNNNITDNAANSNNEWGIFLEGGFNNRLINNTANFNINGISISSSSNNAIFNNTANNNTNCGIHLYYSSNNLIFRNNFMNNSLNANDTHPANNDWHHPVLLEGNYWSDYAGVDDGSGTGKHAIAGDGIGDTLIPHPDANYDNYPFMNESLWERTSVTIPTATGTGNVTINTSSGYFCDETAALNASFFPCLPDSAITFPHGFFNITISGLNTINPETVTINFTFPSAIPTNAEFWKYNSSNGTWYRYPFGDNDGDNFISITITDNGAGDHNPALGIINDPNGIGWRMVAAKVPALTPIGMLALMGIMSAVLAVATLRKRK